MPRFEWDIANVHGTSVDTDGYQSTQHDADGEDQAGAPPNQSHHLFGSWGRAPDAVVEPSTGGGTGQPDPSKSAGVLVAMEGGVGHSWDLEHPPTIAILPTPLGGEHVTYSSAGNFTRHFNDGRICRSTTDAGGHGGRTISDWVTPTAFTRDAPWGREGFDATGWRVNHVGGARLTLGFISGLPAPFGGKGQSYVRAQADMVEINGSAITIGPTGAIGQPVAQALPLSAILTSIGAALTALQTAVGGAGPGGPAAAAASLPFVTAAMTQIAAALTTISTQTAIG